jgi:autotransporter-associated beta strand protein
MKTPKSASAHIITFLALTLTPGLYAIDWSNGTGNTFWGDTGNWTGAVVPNAIDASARIPTSSSNQIVVLADATGADASFTVGSYSIGTVGGAASHNYRLNNVASGTGRLIFDKSSGNASLAFNNIFADATMSINVGLTLNDNLTISVGRGSGTYQINGQISSGSGLTTGIIMTGSGTIQLGGANNYTGSTTINAGTVKLITGNDRLTTTTDLILDGGASSAGTLDLNSRNQKVGSLAGTANTVLGKVTNSSGTAGTATLTVESDTANTSFAGLITDGTTAKVAFTKAGTAILTLSGANSYTGATIVNGGALIVDGSLAAGSAVSVNSGGTLGGSGTIGGNTTLAAGSKLSAGSASAATLTFSGTLNIAAAANDTGAFVFTLGTSFDKIVASSLTLGTGVIDAADFSFTTGPGFADGQSYTLFESTSVSGTFTSFLLTNIGGSGIDGTIALSGNNVILTTSAIPEPSTYTALLGGAALLAVSIVRRRR